MTTLTIVAGGADAVLNVRDIDGEVIDFSTATRWVAVHYGTSNTFTVDTDVDTGSIVGDADGNVTFSYQGLTPLDGTFVVSLKVYDPGHPNGQVIADECCGPYLCMDVCGSPPSETIVLYGAVFGTSDNATVSLGWNPISDADGYVLKRDGTVIFTADSGTTVNYLDTPGAGDYDYEVIAFNSGGEGSSDTLNILVTPDFFVVAEESVEFSSSDSLDLVSPTPLQVGDVLTLTWGIYRLTGTDFNVTAPQFTTPNNLKSATGNGSNNVGIGGGYVDITAGNVGTINWAVAFPSEASGIAVLRVVRGIPIGTLFFSSQNLNASAGFAGGVFEYKIQPRTQDQFSQLAAISIGNNGITADPAMFGAQSFSGGNISMTIAYINVPANTNPTFDITMTGEVVASAHNDLSIDSS